MTEFLVLFGLFLLAGLAISFLIAAIERKPQRLYRSFCPYCEQSWEGQDRWDVIEKGLIHARWWHK